MNVLIIPSWYPGKSDSLLGVYHKDYAKALSKYENVNMLFINKYGLSYIFKYLFIKNKVIVNESGYKTYIYKMLDLSKISKKLELIRYRKVLDRAYKDYIKSETIPDIIHAQVTLPAGYGSSCIGKKYNIPVLVTEHSSNYYQYFKGINKEFGDYVINNSHYSTVSNYMKNELNLNKCYVIPNIVDTSVFNKKKYKRGKTLRLICIAGFRNGKNLDDIIKVIDNLVNKKKMDVHLDMVGDGYLMPYLNELVDSLNLRKYISFKGCIKDKNEIAKLLASSDIYLVASDIETFCIPGVEALASGTPVVSSRCKGTSEYVDSKCGEFFNCHDIDDFSDAIIRVSKKLDSYDINYLKSVASKYSSDEVCKKAIKIYKEIIKK